MDNFGRGWIKEKKSNKNATEGLRNSLKTQQPLKPRIESAKNRVQIQNRKLENMLEKLKSREKYYFEQIVSSLQNHDSQQGKMLSTELAQIKRTTRTMSQLKLALDQVQLRLESTVDVGDAMFALGPAIGTLSQVKSKLSGVMPEVDTDLDEMNNVFNDILTNVNGFGNNSFNFGRTSDDIEKIMAEANIIAEQRTNMNFPDIPDNSNSFTKSRSSLGNPH